MPTNMGNSTLKFRDLFPVFVVEVYGVAIMNTHLRFMNHLFGSVLQAGKQFSCNAFLM